MKTYTANGNKLVEETVIPEKVDTVEYDYDFLLAQKRGLEEELAKVNTLIAEAEKLGVKGAEGNLVDQ